jgi:hypothetical protein
MRSPPLLLNHELARPERIAIADHHQPSAGKRHAGDRGMGDDHVGASSAPSPPVADHLLTMTDTPRQKTGLLIHQGRIDATGLDLPSGDAYVIDLSGHVLMPGFFDTHWHMWNTAAPGLWRSEGRLHADYGRDIAPFYPCRRCDRRGSGPRRSGELRHHHRAQLGA